MTPSGQAALARELASEREARKRQESLWALMPVVASTLDIREIFQRASSIAREAIPHDSLGSSSSRRSAPPRPGLEAQKRRRATAEL